MMSGRTLQIRMTPELTARLDAVATGLNIRPATLEEPRWWRGWTASSRMASSCTSRTMLMKRYRTARGSANDNR